jgi:hypothetical protein
MNVKHLNASSLAAVAFVLIAGAANCAASEGVLESFERMLTHEPGRGVPLASAQVTADPLVEAMVVPLRDGIRPAPPRAADPVAESFARMLAHVPSTHVPPVPAGIGADPLIAAVVEPLRQWLAGNGAAERQAIALSAGTGR